MDQSLMDELRERIKLLEEESKILKEEYNILENEFQLKKTEQFTKNWLSEKDKEENEKKSDEFMKKAINYKKMIEESFSFPKNPDPNNITLPANLKNPKFNDIEILNLVKLIN